MIRRVASGTIGACLLAWLASPWVAQTDANWGFSLPAIVKILGVALIAGANALIYSAQDSFARQGGGTGVPGDAPKRLVIAGLYRWARNPLYLSGNAILLGVALLLTSPTLLVLTGISVLAFHLFVILIEEPQLGQRYGEVYRAYQRTVPRWIPRRPKDL